MTREDWLTKLATEHLWPWIEGEGGHVAAKWRVSVGFPKGSRGGKSGHAIGQCWSKRASADGTIEIFVSPELGVDRAVDVLLHELVHASVGPEKGHKLEFSDLAKAVGLAGPMRATTASDALSTVIQEWLKLMPAYPHAPLNPGFDLRLKKPGSRLLKVACPGCGYTARVTRSWLEFGAPLCPKAGCPNYHLPMTGEIAHVQH